MDVDAAIFVLFRVKAKELEDSSLVKSVNLSSGLSTKLEWSSGGPLSLERVGPSEDDIRSTVLTIRLFCQDKDISIRKVAELVSSLPIDQSIKDEVAQHRTDLNSFLDAPTSIGLKTAQGLLSRRELFHTFLYGFYAHLRETSTTELLSGKSPRNSTI